MVEIGVLNVQRCKRIFYINNNLYRYISLMSNLNFDLNINNYSKPELISLLNINIDYNLNILHTKIVELGGKIFSLELSKVEKKELKNFLKNVENKLKQDLEKSVILDTQEKMGDEIQLLKTEIRKNKKK